MDENKGIAADNLGVYADNDFERCAEPTTRLVPLDKIYPDPLNPRKHFEAAALQELADSIRTIGIIQPPALRPHPDPVLRAEGAFMLICGERRWRASRLAGLHEIRTEIHEGISELDVRRQQITENYARKDLNIVEEAEALQAAIESLAEAGYASPQGRLAASMGMNETTMSRKLRVLKYNPEVRALVRDGVMTQVNALAALDKLKPTERQFFVEHAREQVSAGIAPDVAGFLKGPKKFIEKLQPRENDTPAPEAKGVKPAKVAQWAVRWAVGRGDFIRLVEKTGYQLDTAALHSATDEELRAHFEAFKLWLCDVRTMLGGPPVGG